jgi:hypothetical protein
MSGASWEPDPKLTRPAHKWVLSEAYPQEWGATVSFYCDNPGCPTTLSIPCIIEESGIGNGLCFDRDLAIQLTDRDGNPIPNRTNIK